MAFASIANLAIVPLQDVLGLDGRARMNTPSRSDGNWGWRYQPDALTKELAEKLAVLSVVSDRAPQVEAATVEAAEEFAA
jgi:4-alpha-glucanotransferase